MQKTKLTFTALLLSSTLFNISSIHSMEHKKNGLAESDFFENHTTSNISVLNLNVVLAHFALEKHRKLINDGSNEDLLTHSKAYSPRYYTSSSSSAYMNTHAKTEAELLINPTYYEIRTEAPSEPTTINDESGLLY